MVVTKDKPVESIPVVHEFLEVFPYEVFELPPRQQVEFVNDHALGMTLV